MSLSSGRAITFVFLLQGMLVLPNIFSCRLKDKGRPNLLLAALAVDTNYHPMARTNTVCRSPLVSASHGRLVKAKHRTPIQQIAGTNSDHDFKRSWYGKFSRIGGSGLTLSFVLLLPREQRKASRVNPGRLLYFAAAKPSRMAFSSTAIHSRELSIST